MPSFCRRPSWASLLASFVVIFSLLARTSADLQISPLENPLDIPLRPIEYRFELNDAGSSNIGPSIDKYESLLAAQEPPSTHSHQKRYGSGAPYWEAQIKRQGSVAYGRNSSYVIWRNVKDYGAVGDGVTDDTDAFNNATADGNRCGYFTGGYIGGTTNYDGYYGCDSQTTTPAIVYVPPGTYRISAPVILYYYTQIVGDANDLPVIKATSDFYGIGIFDTDPYVIYQTQWYQNQNNFYRHIRNFVFDSTDVPPTQAIHGIHWQVAQAASMQNLVFNMPQGTPGDGNQHQGVFMDNGSSQFFEDLIFNGGGTGLFAGNQQMSIRNLTFNGCNVGIDQNWGWIFTYKSLTFNECGVGIDMTEGNDYPVVHSMVVTDSVFNDCDYGVLTTFSSNSTPVAAGTMVLDNINFVNTDPAVAYPNNTVIVPGNQRVTSYVQGTHYIAYDALEQFGTQECWDPTTNYSRIQGVQTGPTKNPEMLDQNGNFYERSRPQYEGEPVENFISIMDFGCPNDGVTDATTCVQNYFDSIPTNQIAFIDHGAYVISDTVTIPNNIRIIGEIWPLFMATGDNFQDQYNPIPAFRVGQPGDTGGTTEISQICFETIGPTPGAIIMEWNLACAEPVACGLWDTHWRIGGSNGTQLQNNNCIKNPDTAHSADPDCWAAFLLLHVTNSAYNVILSHNWFWVADHELDLDGKDQIDIYNGRNLLIESPGPMWVYGLSSEHSQLYNTNVANAKNIYFSMIQSETAYMQTNPNSLSSFTPQTKYSDPTFSYCYSARCYKTVAFQVINSTYIYTYGGGLYSFFENYDSACLTTENCDQQRINIVDSEALWMYAISSVAAQYILSINEQLLAPQAQNMGTFCQTLGWFWYP